MTDESVEEEYREITEEELGLAVDILTRYISSVPTIEYMEIRGIVDGKHIVRTTLINEFEV